MSVRDFMQRLRDFWNNGFDYSNTNETEILDVIKNVMVNGFQQVSNDIPEESFLETTKEDITCEDTETRTPPAPCVVQRSEKHVSGEYILLLKKQAKESLDIVYSTTKPDAFFGRLNFSLDIFLELKKHEKNQPDYEYNYIISNLDKIVDAFITRVVEECQWMKYQTSKQSQYVKTIIALISAFDCAKTFWKGNGKFPHYDGPLFSQSNYDRAEALYYECDDIGDVEIDV